MKRNWKVVYGSAAQYWQYFTTWGEAADYAGGLVESGWPKAEVAIQAL